MAQFFRFLNSTRSRDSLKFESMKMVKCDKKSHTLRTCNVMLINHRQNFFALIFKISNQIERYLGLRSLKHVI